MHMHDSRGERTGLREQKVSFGMIPPCSDNWSEFGCDTIKNSLTARHLFKSRA